MIEQLEVFWRIRVLQSLKVTENKRLEKCGLCDKSERIRICLKRKEFRNEMQTKMGKSSDFAGRTGLTRDKSTADS
jgi:hypothetical protein